MEVSTLTSRTRWSWTLSTRRREMDKEKKMTEEYDHVSRLEKAAAICVQMSDLFEELAALIESELDEIAPLRGEK